EQDDVTCVQIADELRDAVADDLVGEPDLAAEQFGEDAGDRLHRELGLELAFGASEMRRQDEPGTAVQKGLNRGEGGPNSGVVAHLAVGERDVEVDPAKDAAVVDVEVSDRGQGHLAHGLPQSGSGIDSARASGYEGGRERRES